MKRVNDIEPLGTKSRLQNILDNIKVFYRIKDQQDAILVHDVLIIIFKFMVPFEDIAKFLTFVAHGEQAEAEKILKNDLSVSLFPGNVVDLSGRNFNGITGLQYALWSLDSRMYSMIAEDMPTDIIKQQIAVLRNGALNLPHDTRGDVLLQNLIDALSKFINLCGVDTISAGSCWDDEVGTAQQQLPAHVVNVYCNPKQSLKNFQNINDTDALPRSRSTNVGDWFADTYNGKKIGSGCFAYYRGGERNYPYASGGQERWTTQTTSSKEQDRDALTRYRAQQLVALNNFLQDLNKITADNANQGLKFK